MRIESRASSVYPAVDPRRSARPRQAPERQAQQAPEKMKLEMMYCGDRKPDSRQVRNMPSPGIISDSPICGVSFRRTNKPPDTGKHPRPGLILFRPFRKAHSPAGERTAPSRRRQNHRNDKGRPYAWIAAVHGRPIMSPWHTTNRYALRALETSFHVVLVSSEVQDMIRIPTLGIT